VIKEFCSTRDLSIDAYFSEKKKVVLSKRKGRFANSHETGPGLAT
jgi:hypothetical protein